ncbi:DNA-binding transcriptional regulator, AcrR family [Amycolatopsis xylanica]|uniref:DNA-binding transcriptional regulator, AcrR family n=1 Tax=Amycolatopsis xylanica TaxID=589385 RepID=A0A1H3EEU2_9PSEU|nr:TetR/AcrR family transcriptional regulator [Amycolatopsis xylanica]SDX77236.1 DNA-binding transcriptional regulator, AcrR family [Amycolatopsis xylanica]
MKRSALTPAAEKVLDVAGRLFYENGIHAVGVQLIAQRAGVTKKTLYARFGSKDKLVEQCLARRDERWREHVAKTLDRNPRDPPIRRLLRVFDALDAWMALENHRGCGFVNAHAELPDGAHPGRHVIGANKIWMLTCLRSLAGEAGARDPRRLAYSLLILMEGATVTASLGVVPGAVAHAKTVAKVLIEDAC